MCFTMCQAFWEDLHSFLFNSQNNPEIHFTEVYRGKQLAQGPLANKWDIQDIKRSVLKQKHPDKCKSLKGELKLTV